MAENKFELVGKVTWIDIQYYDTGFCVVKTFLAQKTSKKDEEGKPIYNSFLISFIDGANAKIKIAEKYVEEVKKDDYVRIKGFLSIDKFIPKNTTKPVENISLLGKMFNHVVWDELEKTYIDVR